MKKFLPLILTALLIGFTQTLFAQGSTSSNLTGVVRDASGEPLTGATVIAVHQPTGAKYGNLSNVDGRFRLSNLQSGGPYSLTVSFLGYKESKQGNIFLKLGQTLNLKIVLQEESTQLAEVVVSADAYGLTDGTGTQTRISEEDISNIPTASRALADYLRLTPQANIGQNGDGATISIAGQNNRFNSIFVVLS